MKSKIIGRGTAFAAALTMAVSVSAAVPASAASAGEDFTKAMGAGWNLGNTLDATGGSGVGSETSWQEDKTTRELIEAVHDAGFETIRIPVSWAKHVDGNYKIDSEWMARVKEIVDYAYNDGMHVILNIHHDNMWTNKQGKVVGNNGDMGFYPDSEHKEKSLKYLTTVWQQIADEFRDYDENLIFETLNEPRLAGTSFEWQSPQWDDSATMTDSANTINEFNQQIVNTIRSGGGYNKTRYIMAPGYAASLGSALADIYKLPDDPISGNQNKIIVSVHAYTPYNLCLGDEKDITSSKYINFTSSGKTELDNMFRDLKNKFTSKGIRVVIGEMGASDKNNNDARTAWAAYFYDLSKDYNIPCVLWDNNARGGDNKSENHRHINRAADNLTWVDPDVINAIMDSMGVANRVIKPDPTIVNKKEQSVKVDSVPVKTFEDAAFNITATASGGGELTYESSDTNVVTVSTAGKVNIIGAGSATITVTAGETKEYKSAKATVNITVNPKAITPTISAIPDQQYTGSAIKPNIIVKDGAKAISSTNYNVIYSNNVEPGKATVNVTMKGNYTGTASAKFNIVGGSSDVTGTTPSKVKLTSYSSNTTKIKVKYNAAENATGYRSYRYNEETKKWVKVKDTKNLYFIDSDLQPGTIYKYKVRAYNKTNGVVTWGEPSNAAVTITKPKKVVCTKASKNTSAIKLTWKAVNCSYYQLQMYDTAANEWVTKKTVSSKSTSATVKGLKSGKTYKFRIRAYTKTTSGKVKYGEWSKTYSVKTK